MNIRGFGLVEVLLALAVISVGAVALFKLQGAFIRSSTQGSAHDMALQLAEAKLADLHTFEVIGTTSGKFAYQDIENDIGGSMKAGDYTLEQYRFHVSWTVIPKYWISGDWKATAPIPQPVYAAQKLLTVNVSWQDVKGSLQTVSLEGIATPTLSLSQTDLRRAGASEIVPRTRYRAEPTPVPFAMVIRASGLMQESTSPLPTLAKKSFSTEVQTTTVRYQADGQAQSIEQQKTLSCQCSIASLGAALLPAQMSVSPQDPLWAVGATVSKTRGEPQAKQSALCRVCCTNHFDNPVTDFSSYYQQQNPEHSHYQTDDGQRFDEAFGPGDSYLESCRLQRIDGFDRPMPDWNLIALTVLSRNFLADPNQRKIYQDYVKQTVKTYVEALVANKSNPALMVSEPLPESFDVYYKNQTQKSLQIELKSGSEQLIARGIYVDFMPESVIDVLLATHQDRLSALLADDDFLAQIPFNELDVTLLANWQSSDSKIVAVSNDAPRTLSAQSNYENYAYSRGRISILKKASGTADVAAVMRRGNSGIALFASAIAPADEKSLNASLPIVVKG